MTKITFLTEGNKISGPNTWKNGLINELKKNNYSITEVNGNKFPNLKQCMIIQQSDIIHSYSISGFTIFYFSLSKILNKKIIFSLHGDFYDEKSSKAGLRKFLWVYLHEVSLTLADKVTFPSYYLSKSILKNIPSILDKSTVIFNGIKPLKQSPLAPIKNNKKEYLLLEITGFNIYKKASGIVPLINAVNKLKNEYNLKLYILGDGKYFNEFQKKYSSNSIHFLGRQSPVDKYIKKSNLVVHSTFLETFGYVILEALSFNRPVISVNVGGIPEILPSYAITLPKEATLYALIKKFMKDNTLSHKLLKESKIILEKFYWQNIVKQFITLYEN